MFKAPKRPPTLRVRLRKTAEYGRLKYLPKARKPKFKAIVLQQFAIGGFEEVLRHKYPSPLGVDRENKKCPQMRLGKALKIVQDVACVPIMREARRIIYRYSQKSRDIKKQLAALPKPRYSLMSLHEREVYERNVESARRELEAEKREMEKNTIQSLQDFMFKSVFDPELLNYSPHEILMAFELMRQHWGPVARAEYVPSSKNYEAFWKYFRMSVPTKEKKMERLPTFKKLLGKVRGKKS